MELLGTTIYWVSLSKEGQKKPLKCYITKDGDFDEILLSTQVMKKWGILPNEFPRVNKKKFLESSEEDVDIDEEVQNMIWRFEMEIKINNKGPLGRSQREVKIYKECEEIRKWAIKNYPEVFKKTLGKENRVKCEPVKLVRKEGVEPKRKKKGAHCRRNNL